MRAWELNEVTETVLYHTTSNAYAREILDTGIIRPKNGEAFISFSKKPFTGDISHNEVTLKIDAGAIALDVMEVEYTERWYERYPDHAGYIAGEGWRDQFVAPNDCYNDEGEEDQDCFELAWRDAELDSFLWKKDEEEVISKIMGQPIQIGNAELLENKAINLTPNVKLWVNAKTKTVVDVPSDLHHTQMAHLYPQKFGLSGNLFNDYEYPMNDEGKPEIFDVKVASVMFDADWVRANMGSKLQTAMVHSNDLKQSASALRTLKQRYNEIDGALIDIGAELNPSESYTLENDEYGKGPLRVFMRTGKIPPKSAI